MKIRTQYIRMAFAALLSCLTLSLAVFPAPVVSAADVTVTVYMYVYDINRDGQVNGSVFIQANGSGIRKAIPRVLVTGRYGNGVPFAWMTNDRGYVNITGAAGTWTFNSSMNGYQTSIWANYVTSSTAIQAFMVPSGQSGTGYNLPFANQPDSGGPVRDSNWQ
jgi:hypothetical protein